ncbi:hypothetical protein SDC9_58740 [bioreactor metagenome]|uniref:Uncharacterized protein n=1 Tax=bioreactor metagenome TaxID=1076179 RepID=A0A644X8Z0_9ZZZZ
MNGIEISKDQIRNDLKLFSLFKSSVSAYDIINAHIFKRGFVNVIAVCNNKSNHYFDSIIFLNFLVSSATSLAL